MTTIPMRVAARVLILLLTTTLLGFAPGPISLERAVASPTTAQAAATTQVPAKKVAAKKSKQAKKAAKQKARKSRAVRAIKFASSRAGKPYRYGANGPNAFDCSGLVQWAFKKAGKKLPRTSGAQAGATRKVGKPRRGDLVFFHNGGRVYHVGIYAGKNKIWHASKPGTPVKKARIWTNAVFYGRVR